MSDGLWPLPQGWQWRKAAQIAQIIGGGTPTTSDESNFDDCGMPWITPADLTGYEDAYITRGRRGLSEKGLSACGARVLPTGTVLYSSRAPIGYCAIASNPISTNQGFKSLVLGDGSVPEYVRYYFLASKDYAEGLASGTTFKELSGSRMAELLIPVAPPEEQRRIVTKLDSLFARSRSARKELARIPRLVDRYKQAVLAAAFGGDLAVRKSKTGWSVKPLCQFADLQLGKMLDKAKNKGAPAQYLRNVNVRWFVFDLADLRQTRFSEAELEKFAIKNGDIIICEGGEPGRAAIWNSGPTTLKYQKALHRVRVHPGHDQEWITYQFFYLANSGELAEHFSGTTIKHLPKDALGKVEFVVPPVEIQRRLVKVIKRAFRAADGLLTESERAANLLDRLDQATLAKAFRGQLAN